MSILAVVTLNVEEKVPGVRRARSMPLVIWLFLISAFLTSCGGGGSTGGGGGSGSSPPSPQNVAANAGYHSTHLTWDAVSSATSYNVYAADVPNTASSTIAPVSVDAPPYNATGLPNWRPVFYRVSAIVGGSESELSAEVSATPTGGWLIANRGEAGQLWINVYRADVAGGAPVQSVPGARAFFACGSCPPSQSLSGIGVLYGKDHSDYGFAEIGLFSLGAQRIVLANQPGHAYNFYNLETAPYSLVNGRLLVRDATMSGVPFSVRSFATNGSDARTLISGCTSPTSLSGSTVEEKGLLFNCGGMIYFSDGLAPAVRLPGSSGLTPVTTDGQSAILKSATKLFTQPTNGSGSPIRLSPDAGGTDSLIAAADSIAVVNTQTSPNRFNNWFVTFDGQTVRPGRQAAPGQTRPGIVTPDHKHLLAIVDRDQPMQNRAYLFPVHADGTSPILLSPGTATTYSAWLYDDGDVLLNNAGSAAWQVMRVGSAGATVGPTLGTSSLDWFWANVGEYTILEDNPYASSRHALRAWKKDGSAWFVLTSQFDYLGQVQTLPQGRVLYIDANNIPWVATPDNALKVQLDTAACDEIEWAGSGEGNRDFYAVHHMDAPHDWITIAFEVGTRRIDRIISGPSIDSGYYLP